MPIFLFVILFGLSMDYHVFILSRIREAYDRGMSIEEAIRTGSSPRPASSRAPRSSWSASSRSSRRFRCFFKQFGVGLAAAILIDATVVRAVLLPASMKVLGDWNWYLPNWLEWLPHLGVSEDEAPRESDAAAPVSA